MDVLEAHLAVESGAVFAQWVRCINVLVINHFSPHRLRNTRWTHTAPLIGQNHTLHSARTFTDSALPRPVLEGLFFIMLLLLNLLPLFFRLDLETHPFDVGVCLAFVDLLMTLV